MKHCTVCKVKYDDSVSFCPVDGEVLEDDPSSIVNTVLDGQYQIESLLGKGGMGAVYSARHILLGDRVAIKIMPPEVRNNAEWLRRFRREGQAARRFRHPNAVTVYDLRTAGDGTIYMVMEYVEGHTLDAELKKRGRFTASEALETLEPIMSVLETAHSMGVVHRDLKPENIMVGKPGGSGPSVVKLLDLGIAKMREIAGVESGGNTALTMAGQVLGTPYYMSPEQWGEIPRDENLEIDGRADIYSLGLVFYEMISGKRCYSGMTLHELRREHIATTLPPLNEVMPDVPRGFSDALVRATAKDRSGRQSTAGELSAELRAGLGSPAAGYTGTKGGSQVGSLAETIAVSKALDTSSEVNAPTIITLDSPALTTAAIEPISTASTAPTKYEAAKRQPADSPQPGSGMSAHMVAESADMASIVTIPQPPRASQTEVVVPPARSKSGLIAGAVVLVILLVAGIGGFFVFNRLKSKPAPPLKGTDSSSSVAASAPREVGRYWLELEKPPTRVAGLVPIASGQTFRVHFVFSEDGYVYLIGPGGSKNEPTAFLTAKPHALSGLKSNETKQGADLSFPSGDGNWLTLDSHPGSETYTVIFSKALLTTPAFLNAPSTLEPLTATQQAELKDFLAKYKEKPPTAELDESNTSAPFARIKVPPDPAGNPIVFDFRIQHN
jgi:serine/threonine protein kinase